MHVSAVDRGIGAMAKFKTAMTAIIALLFLAHSGVAQARDGKVALTFDDLPALTILPDQAYVDYLNIMIIRGLKRHRFPATGFVNESKLDELKRDRQIAN